MNLRFGRLRIWLIIKFGCKTAIVNIYMKLGLSGNICGIQLLVYFIATYRMCSVPSAVLVLVYSSLNWCLLLVSLSGMITGLVMVSMLCVQFGRYKVPIPL